MHYALNQDNQTRQYATIQTRKKISIPVILEALGEISAVVVAVAVEASVVSNLRHPLVKLPSLT